MHQFLSALNLKWLHKAGIPPLQSRLQDEHNQFCLACILGITARKARFAVLGDALT